MEKDVKAGAKASDSGAKGDVAHTTRLQYVVVLSMVYTAITLTNLDKWTVYLLLTLDGFQLLHFSWKSEYMLGTSEGFFFSSLGGFVTEYSTFQILFYVAFLVVLLNVIAIGTICILMHKGQFRSFGR